MPPESSVRILFVGDMHLGRLPSSVPQAVIDQGGFSPRDLGPAAAWQRIVDAALSHRVHAVALAGDLVDRDNAMFEAYGPLATGIRRLTEHGVLVAAVAGNHDTEVLPRLAAEIPDFHLLGPGGTWSEMNISGDQGFNVQLVGWSFPARHHTASHAGAYCVTTGWLNPLLDRLQAFAAAERLIRALPWARGLSAPR